MRMISTDEKAPAGRIVLCTGGARSGKSEFAEHLVLSLDGQKGYVATSQAFDDEMKDRIAKHRERRGPQWRNFEIPFKLHETWATVLSQCDIILVDCLTMYTTNAMLQDNPDTQEQCHQLEQQLMAELTDVIEQARKAHKTVVFVTNELGLGIVPDNAMARHFRDIAGLVNQTVAVKADEVYLTLSGITIEIKSREVVL